MNITVHHSGSRGNLYQVDDILIDPGVPIKATKKALNFRLSEIRACLCGHFHSDHSKAAKDILRAGIDLYCSQETAEALKLSGHRLHIIEPMKEFKINRWRILPFPLVHDAPNLGFLLQKGGKKCLYCNDTNYISHKFRGLNFILLGVNYDAEILKENVATGTIDPEVAKRVLQNHMSLETAKGFFRANDMSKVEAIYLLHLSDANSDEERFKKEIETITGRPVYT